MEATKTRTEECRVSGEELLDKVKELVEEGKTRRVVLKDDDGRTLLEVPLLVGVAGAAAGVLLAPTLAAIGALAAVVTHVTLVVEHEDEAP